MTNLDSNFHHTIITGSDESLLATKLKNFLNKEKPKSYSFSIYFNEKVNSKNDKAKEYSALVVYTK